MRRTLSYALLATCAGAAAGAAQSGVDAHPPIYFELPGISDVRVTRNLVYKTASGGTGPARSLALDVYAPPGRSANPAPIVVFVHGGLTLDSPGDAKAWSSF